MTTLDDLRLRVVPGDGIVLRAPGVTAVAFPAGDQHQSIVTSFLDAVRSAEGQDDAGRRSARMVAGLLAAADDAPPLGLLGADGDGLAVLLHGDVEFTYRDASGGDQTLTGRDSAAWLDRLLEAVPAQWSLARGGAGAADEWSDLQAGVARGDGVATGAAVPAPEPAPTAEPEHEIEPEVAPAPAPAPAPEAAAVEAAPPPPPPSVPESVPAPTPVPAPEPETAPQAAVPPAPPLPTEAAPEPVPADDFESVSLLEPPEEDSVRAPLPLAGTDVPPPPPEPDEPAVPLVQGVLCGREGEQHFNDPESAFCAICGLSMVQVTHNLVQGPRPSLGVLVLDDGSTYVVDRDIVVGREPDTDPDVVGGKVRGITLPDPERAISRVHARITLHEWEVRVSDAGSANGTFVATRAATQWTPVTPESPAVLTPGMHVLVGPRVLSFDTHRRS